MAIHKGLFLAAVVLLAPLAGAGCSQPMLLSRDDEITIGRDAAPEFEAEFGGKVNDPQLQAYIQSIGRRLEAVTDRAMPYRFAALNSETPNAFALPDGSLYVTVGLLRLMTNERQLAAVLGHEIGHVVHRDGAKALERAYGVQILAAVAGAAIGGDAGTAAEMGTKIVGSLVNLNYSRKQEYAADQAGIVYLHRAGYNPYGMVELLNALMESHGGEEGSGLGEMFQTHPLTTKRIEEVRGIIEDEYPTASAIAPDPNAGTFLRMRARLAAPQSSAGSPVSSLASNAPSGGTPASGSSSSGDGGASTGRHDGDIIIRLPE
jgi:predicted Zn-dependent protease